MRDIYCTIKVIEWMNKWVNVNEWTIECINDWMKEFIREWMTKWINDPRRNEYIDLNECCSTLYYMYVHLIYLKSI